MKVRFETQCVRCRRRMNVGTFAVRAFGSLWCQPCYQEWREKREGVRGK